MTFAAVHASAALALKPLIDEILLQSGFKPGDHPIKALAGVVLPGSDAKGDVSLEPLPVAAPKPA